jgi:uncharacterized glyoxalase superfamily protein PhnB
MRRPEGLMCDSHQVRPVSLSQLNLIVRDMEATVGFYRRLAWSIETPTSEHSRAVLPGGLRVEFDTQAFASVWDAGYGGETGGSTLIGVETASRVEVDELYADLVAHGARERQPPYDAFWGARFAIVEDPDGNPVGLLSPVEDSRRFWPPREPPQAACKD